MPFVQNFPFFSIILPILCGILCLSLKSKTAKYLSLAAYAVECIFSGWLLIHVMGTAGSFTYMMGHFPAPFGNEIRAGPLEALMALAFPAIMLLSVLGGQDDLQFDIPEKKQNFFYLMTNFLLAAMLVIIYTNDLFTAYVFIEIITISSCSIIAAKQGGKPLIATISYLIMSLIGSSFLLLSIAILYSLTGHLLMPQIHLSVQALARLGHYDVPLFVLIGLMTAGLGIKSALFPFHAWLPNAHANATTAASSVLSGLIVKCYLFLLAKIFVRVFGIAVINWLRAGNILLVFGAMGLIAGSVMAIRQKDIKQMLSYSTVAQIGYICIALGLGSVAGIAAACFHILAHAAAKSLLFTSAGGLLRASGHKKDYGSLRGAARRDPASGAAFICGALSMVGMPLFSGFVSKLYISSASAGTPFEAATVASVIVISTALNAMYYFPMIICLLAKGPGAEKPLPLGKQWVFHAALAVFMAINLFLGFFSQPIFRIIDIGLSVFG